jgi:SAM-dependent methyltransferase
MPSNLAEWDSKHRVAAGNGLAEPAGIVQELVPLLPDGPVLDLACGTGRHSLLLAEASHPVTAVDGSSVALGILAERARGQNFQVHHSNKREIEAENRNRHIRLVQADLERAILPTASFAVILCVHYLQRSLHPRIVRALAPGGMLVFETHTLPQLEFAHGPHNPAFLLKAGELRGAFQSLELVFYRELRAGQGIATLVAQKAGHTR